RPLAEIGPRPSIGRPRPSSTLPRSSGPQGIVSEAPRARIRSPELIPDVSPSGTDSSRPSRNPTTSTSSAWPPRCGRTSQISPTLATGPRDSTSRPTTRVTCPTIGAGSSAGTWLRYAASDGVNSATEANGVAVGMGHGVHEQRLRELGNLRFDPDVDEADLRLHDAATAADGGIGEDLHRA